MVVDDPRLQVIGLWVSVSDVRRRWQHEVMTEGDAEPRTDRVHDMPSLRSSARATLTISEVAELLEVDVRTVSRAARDGQIPAITVGRRILIPREPLLAMLAGKSE